METLPDRAPGARWVAILRRASAEEFAAAFRADVVLQAALIDGSIVGPAGLRTFFDATRALYETFHFLRETAGDGCTVLEWEGTALGGREVAGVTVLDHDSDGVIARVTLLHRPYAMVVACAAAIGAVRGSVRVNEANSPPP